jgi:AcrR family transcriptional regulator
VPRRYTLGKREEAKAETRERIVAAAIRLYREVGFGDASVVAIARAADVAPATVRNHFPGPSDLADATADAVLVALDMPDVSMFDGLEAVGDRVRRLVTALSDFYERGTEWWQIRQRDRDLSQAWASQEIRYEARRVELVRAALQPLGRDEDAVAVLSTVVETTYFSLRAAGASAGTTVATILDLVLPWLERRRR